MKAFLRGWSCCLVMVSVVLAPAQAQDLGRTANGRWLTLSGATPYFVGVDMQQLAADPTVDYVAKLNILQANYINWVRVWAYPYFGNNFLSPWTKLSNGDFNLDSWNPTYWSRLRGFVSAARSRGIIVQVTIFAPNSLRTSTDWKANCLGESYPFSNAWNKNCNVNGVFSPNSAGSFIPEFFDLDTPGTSTSGKRLRDYQQALLDKVVLELGGFGNVYFEVANEFPLNDSGNRCPAPPANCGTYDVYIPGLACANDIDQVTWHQHWLNRLNQISPRLVTAHTQQGWGPNTTGICHYWGMPAVDVLNFHFYNYDPNTISSLLNPAQTRGKVLQNNETGRYLRNGQPNLTDLNNQTRLMWSLLLSGGYSALYLDYPSDIGGVGWADAAARLKALRTIAEAANFSTLSPIDAAGNEFDGRITQGPTAGNRQVMSAPAGQQFLAYFWCTSTGCATKTPAVIGLIFDRSYAYTWYDVRNGTALCGGSLETEQGLSPYSLLVPNPSQYDPKAGLALILTRDGTPPAVACTP